MAMSEMTLPYASSKAGQSREGEIRKTLRGVGATAVGFMVDEDQDLVMCQFRLAGREITIPISPSRYEKAWLAQNKCGPKTKPEAHQARARTQAEIAVWGVLADWVKAQATMMACGLMDVDTAFLAHVHLPDGRRVHEAITAPNGALQLPKPEANDD
jgi:hypothetical protein